MRNVRYDQLSPIQKYLLNEASEVMEAAYNPYSNFYVGAALHSKNGVIITGTNVENAALGSTICAERSALVRANALKLRMFDKIAVIARDKDFPTSQVTAPCGSCRQMLYEVMQIAGEELEVIMATTKKDKIITATIEELLPLGFGPRDLGIDISRYQ